MLEVSEVESGRCLVRYHISFGKTHFFRKFIFYTNYLINLESLIRFN